MLRPSLKPLWPTTLGGHELPTSSLTLAIGRSVDGGLTHPKVSRQQLVLHEIAGAEKLELEVTGAARTMVIRSSEEFVVARGSRRELKRDDELRLAVKDAAGAWEEVARWRVVAEPPPVHAAPASDGAATSRETEAFEARAASPEGALHYARAPDRPPCRFGAGCYRESLQHWLEFDHPADHPRLRECKRVRSLESGAPAGEAQSKQARHDASATAATGGSSAAVATDTDTSAAAATGSDTSAAAATGSDTSAAAATGTSAAVEPGGTELLAQLRAEREARHRAPSTPAPAPSGASPALGWQLATLEGAWVEAGLVPRAANELTVGLAEVLSPSSLADATEVWLVNYMIDLDLICRECPALLHTPRVIVMHGDGKAPESHAVRAEPWRFLCLRPPCERFGTHHSKAIFVRRPERLSVHVFTANFICTDLHNKTNAVWSGHFPARPAGVDASPAAAPPGAAPSAAVAGTSSAGAQSGDFGSDLRAYLAATKALGQRPPPEWQPQGQAGAWSALDVEWVDAYDYRGCHARLIGSVPGRHTGDSLRRWGHLFVRQVLDAEAAATPPATSPDRSWPLVMQFSSLSSPGTNATWMGELRRSFCGPGAPPRVDVVFPTLEQASPAPIDRTQREPAEEPQPSPEWSFEWTSRACAALAQLPPKRAPNDPPQRARGLLSDCPADCNHRLGRWGRPWRAGSLDRRSRVMRPTRSGCAPGLRRWRCQGGCACGTAATAARAAQAGAASPCRTSRRTAASAPPIDGWRGRSSRPTI